MVKNYNSRNIRRLLTEGFTGSQLRDFCFDTPEFQPVYNRLAENSGKDEIIRQVLDHAYRNKKMGLLLNWARENNPTQFYQNKPYRNDVRILLVDDIEDWRKQLGGLLQERDYAVVTAASKEEALERIRHDEPYDLAIIDMRLDEEDEENREGMVLGSWLRDNGYDLPVIIMSAYTMEIEVVKNMTLRPFSFVAVEKGKIGSGGIADLLRQIEFALSWL